MSEYQKNFVVVIRSAGERTLNTCIKLVEDQGVDKNNIYVVNEVPFSEALKESFKIGLESNRKWTFCVDADVLLRSNSINTLLDIADKQKKNVCEIQGLIIDKFFGGPRQGGVHLYRTETLNKAIQAIPQEGVDIRPESRTLIRMREMGYKTNQIPYIVGTHDDEQYYRDIYRKCYTQGVKHVERMELFVKHWRKHRAFDKDFDIALKALSHSIFHSSEIFINTDLEIYKRGFDSLGTSEKGNIEPNEVTLKKIDQIVNQWNKPKIYYKYFPDSAGLDSIYSMYMRKINNVVSESGLSSLPKAIFGKILK